ncbi:hypothetical protein SDC9_178592 [bioreactor metagenome]|uniref:Uncharacterized protein n=1 Tax=bioreactor metagenome TaxID=1076179 RepID=A0A645GWL4_9ZZZZ
MEEWLARNGVPAARLWKGDEKDGMWRARLWRVGAIDAVLAEAVGVAAGGGMAAGGGALLCWRLFEFHWYLYEIVPGFAANFMVMAAVNVFHPQRDERILHEYRQMKHELRAVTR